MNGRARLIPYVLLSALTVASGLGIVLGLSEAPTAHRSSPSAVPPREAISTTTSSTSAPPTTSTPTSATLPPEGLVLDPDGLGAVKAGDDESGAVSTMVQYLGPPTSTTPGDCIGRTEVQWNDLSLEFSNGVLDGYRYQRGGLTAVGIEHPPTGAGNPLLKAMTGVTLGMTLGAVRLLYPPGDFSEVQGGAILVPSFNGELFLGFFSDASSTPLTEVKGGRTCGDF